MTTALVPNLEILPPPQLRLWGELLGVPADFILYGGTALALHLGHRISVDFDFFSNVEFDPGQLLQSLPFLDGARVLQQSPNTLTVLVERGGAVQVSFFGVPRLLRTRLPLLVEENRLQVADLLDLAGTKAAVVQRRAEAKDYLDIDAILQDGRIGLPMVLAAARFIHGPSFNPELTLKALCFFADGDLMTLPQAVQDRLTTAVRNVDLDHLPEVAAPPAEST